MGFEVVRSLICVSSKPVVNIFSIKGDETKKKKKIPWQPALYSDSSFFRKFGGLFNPAKSISNPVDMSINSNSCHLPPRYIHGNVCHLGTHPWQCCQILYRGWNVTFVRFSTNFSCLLNILSLFLKLKIKEKCQLNSSY